MSIFDSFTLRMYTEARMRIHILKESGSIIRCSSIFVLAFS